jgi:NitT/TauT family transport system substrate-binding protein
MKNVFIIILLGLTTSQIGCKNGKSKITIATSKNMWCSLTLIAVEKNYFDEEGLDATVNYLEAGRFCLDAVLSKSADFGNIVDVNVGYLGFTANENINIICEISRAITSGIIAKKSRGITTPVDLKSKTLAFSSGTTSDIFASRFLLKHGIPTDSISFSKIQPKSIVTNMLAKDGADAASTWEPFLSTIKKQLGDDAIIFEEPDIYTAREFVAIRKDWGKSNKSKIEAFLRAIKKANEFALNHKEEAQTIVAKATNLDIQLVKSTWDKYRIGLGFNRNTIIGDINQIGHDILRQQEYRGKTLPDYRKYLDSTYFSEINK